MMKPFKYFPHSFEDIEIMLASIGINSLDELFVNISKEIFLDELNLGEGLTEDELRKKINTIAFKNKELISFRGGGSIDCFIPSITDYLTSRSEFLTSYTPYQPEVSQGTLQYIFEFQSLICELTGLDYANASMYDSATAFAESIIMAVNQTRRNKIMLSKTINPNYLSVINTYIKYKNIEIVYLEEDNYVYSERDFNEKIDDSFACCCFQYPNYYGYLEKYEFQDLLKSKSIKFILNSDISVFSIVKTPKELNADIVCGDCQALGVPMSFGGPYIGYICTTDELLRKLPGRIVGQTIDKDSKTGYVLTLQAREQHIRREKANSNICSNQSLVALMVLIYALSYGKEGLIKTQKLAYQNAHYLENELLKTTLFKKVCHNQFIKEFVLEILKPISNINSILEEKGFLNGIVFDNNKIIFCASERRNKKEIDDFVKCFLEVKYE